MAFLLLLICHLPLFRFQYLSNAVLQAKNASSGTGLPGAQAFDNGLLDLLEGKLAVLRFQIKIREELEAIVSRHNTPAETSDPTQANGNMTVDLNYTNAAQEKAKELSLDLKSITQLYNEYAVPFELWEVSAFDHFINYQYMDCIRCGIHLLRDLLSHFFYPYTTDEYPYVIGCIDF